jgi:hypothetical protein
LTRGVCLIPATGEFIYDTQVVTTDGYITENQNRAGSSNSDMVNSVGLLKSSFPNLKTVSIVCAWFGNDLRASQTLLRPGVDSTTKTSSPYSWQVADQVRSTAYAIQHDSSGNAYFGGTPSDLSIVRCARYLNSQGYDVTFYPFIMNDIETGNTLSDPYGSLTGQEAQPWRGMITTDVHRSQPGTTDRSATAAANVAAFFGTCAASQITCSVDATTSAITYSSTATDFRYRRMIMHYAKLSAAINAVQPGTIKNFLVGSEMRELMSLTDASRTFIAVLAMQTLAQDIKAVLGSSVSVGYASDWSETTGFSDPNGSGFWFHLDPLFADSSIGFVGVDNYMPLADQRVGQADLTHAVSALQADIEGGELWDFYYASQSDRDAGIKTPITNAIYRLKDLRNWWSTTHHDMPGGISNSSPTAWVPQSKPMVFTEYGAAKIDKTSNQPNVFPVPLTGGGYQTGSLPYYSTGVADKGAQVAFHTALISYWTSPALNPNSTVYGGPMIDMTRACAWCWDARPYPEFPTLTSVWSDGDKFNVGHWLNDNILYTPPLPVVPVTIVVWAGQSNAEKMFYSENNNQGVLQIPGVVTFNSVLASGLGVAPSLIKSIKGAVGGTALMEIMDYSTVSLGGPTVGHWWNSNNTPGPLALASVAYAAATTGTVEMLVWDQGEQDWGDVLPPSEGGQGYRAIQKGMLGGGITVAQYYDALSRLFAWFRSSSGFNNPNLPIIISGIGKATYPYGPAIAAGTASLPVVRSQLQGIWDAQRQVINSIPNTFEGARRARTDGDYGPEWPADPELSTTDGIHLVGGPTGYGLHAGRLATTAAAILTGSKTWSANSYTYSGPSNEIVVFGELIANALSARFYWTITTISRVSNVVTATVSPAHGFDTTTYIGMQIVLSGCSDASFNGTFTLTGTPTTNQFVWAQTAGNAASSSGIIDAVDGLQIMKNAIISYKGWTASQLSISDWSAGSSALDYQADLLRLANGPYYGYGRWWNPDNGGSPDNLGLYLGDYLAIRGSSIKGLVFSAGEAEAFVQYSTYTDPAPPTGEGHGLINGYDPITAYQPRVKALFQYLRGRNGNSRLPIYILRAGQQYYSGSFHDYTGIQTAQANLAADATLGNCYIAAYPSGDPGGAPNVSLDPNGYSYTAIGYQQCGQRLADFIKTRL